MEDTTSKDVDSLDAASESAELLARLRDEHALLESRIEAYNSRLYLSGREQMERKRLQKMKLMTKDRIHQLETH